MLATNNVCTLFTNYYGLQVFWTSSPPSGFRQWLRVAAHLDQRTNEKAYGTCRLQSPQPRRARAQSSDDFGDRLAHSTPECRRANNPPRAVVSLAANQPALQVISSISANPRWRLTLGSSRAPSKGRGRHRRRSGARQAENCRSQNPGCTRSHGQLPHRFVSFRSNRLLCAPAPYRDTAPRPVFLAVSTTIANGSFSSELVGGPNGHARRGDCSPGGQYCSADNRHRG